MLPSRCVVLFGAISAATALRIAPAAPLPCALKSAPVRSARAPAPVAAISSMALTHATAAVVSLSGLTAWIAPKFNTDLYGITSDDGIGDSAYYQVRQVGAWQMVNAFVLLAGMKGPQGAAATAMAASAWATIACIPANEYFEKPKGPAVLSALAFAVLGRLTSRGLVPAYVSGAIISLLGLLIHLTPKETASMYKVDPLKATPLFLSMLAVTGSTVFLTGFYVLALTSGLAQRAAFGWTMIANALFAIKFTISDGDGDMGYRTAGTVGPLAFRTAAQTAIGALALLA